MNNMIDIEMAIQRVLERCRKANPSYMHTPSSGETVLQWLAEELAKQREEHAEISAAVNREVISGLVK